jgi:hypothetical protein
MTMINNIKFAVLIRELLVSVNTIFHKLHSTDVRGDCPYFPCMMKEKPPFKKAVQCAPYFMLFIRDYKCLTGYSEY